MGGRKMNSRLNPFDDDIGVEEGDLMVGVPPANPFDDPVEEPKKAAVLEAAPAPQETPYLKAAPVAPVAKPREDDFFGGMEDIPGVTIGEIGKINTSIYPIKRAKFSTKQMSRIAVISAKALVFNTHFLEAQKFNIVCFGGRCCDDMGNPRKRIVLPIVRYTTNEKGEVLSRTLSYEALSLSKDYYESIMTINTLKYPGNITDVDLMVKCSDDTFQKLTFHDAGPARWKNNPEIVKAVKKFWTENFKYLVPVVARPVTEKEYLKIIGAGNEAPPMPVTPTQVADMDDIFGSGR